MKFEALQFLLIFFSVDTMEYHPHSQHFVKGEPNEKAQTMGEIIRMELADSSYEHIKEERTMRNESKFFEGHNDAGNISADDSEDEQMWRREERNDTDENSTDYIYTFNIEDIEEFIYPKTWTWILISFHVLVFVVGILGNFLVCVAVYRNHTMRTVTNYFIVNLALADFLVIIFCLPPTVVWDVTMTWFFGVFMCKLVLFLQNVSVTVSILTLTFISIDRWYAICYPLKFKSTTGRAKTAIGIIWFLSLSTSFPEMVYSTTVANKHVPKETIYFTQCAPSWENETDTYFTIARMVFSYTFPLLFMSIAYLQIIRVLWRSGQISHQVVDVAGRQSNSFAMNMNTTTEGQLKSRKKAAKMLVAVVIMFAICYFPVHLFSLLRLTVGLKNSETNRALAMISHWLCYANSAVNPIIYNFMSGKYRKEFRRAFEHGCYWGTDKNGGQSSAFYRKNHRTTRTSGTRCHYDDSSQKDAAIKLNY